MNIIFRGGSARQFASMIAEEVVGKMAVKPRIRPKKCPVTPEHQAVDAALATLGLKFAERRRVMSNLTTNTVEGMLAEAMAMGRKI